MKSAVDKNTSVFLDGDLSHAETQRRREGGSRPSTIPFDRSSWKRVRLGDVLQVCHGKCQHAIESKTGKYPILATSGEIGRTDSYLYDKPSVLIGRKGTIDKPQYIDSPFWTIDTLFYTKLVEDCNPKFLYYLCLTIDWTSMNEASGVPSLSANRIESLEVAIPDVGEQDKIASALSSIDKSISTQEALIVKYEAIKKATVNLLMTNKAGWHRLRIKDVAQVYDGTHQTPHYTNSGIPFFSVENVTTNTFPGRKRISLEEHRKLTAKFQLRRGDVLMTRIGSIGDCRIVDWDYPSSFYVSLAAIHLNTEMVLPEFFVAYSKTKEFQEEVKIRSLPFAVPQKINLGPISQIQICVPAIKRQREIAAQISAIDDALKNCHAQLAKAQSLKQGMMSYFFG